MADNLIFPMGFDLETAVKNAEREGASAMKRLENVFSRQPLVLRLDNSGFERYSTEFGKNIDQLKERLKELRTQFDAIPLNQKWEQNNGVKTLTAYAKELWDELLRITEILKGVGQGAQQMANQSIREIDKEIAALEKLKQKEIEARQAKQNKQLQTEWNAAADKHKKDSLAEEKRLQEESNRIRKEAEAIARREAEIEKLIVEHKLRQTQAEQAKKRASDEEYANLVKQLRKEERLSAEKARQKALDMRRERQAEATAAIERERSARQQLFEAKRQQWQAEQNAINSQSLSYDALMAKLRTWQNIQNRNEVGSKRWEKASRAIQQTKEMLALVTEEMNRAAKAAERIRALREILTANERTMSGLNAKLAEYNTRLQGLDVGSAKFNKTAMEVARLNEELRRATQYAQDFAQKAFQGLSAGDTNKRVAELQMWRQQLQQVEEEYNRLRNYTMQNGSNASIDRQLNALLEQRMNIVRNINQATLTAEQAQAEREKEINRIIEQRKAKADAIAAKRKAEQAAIQGNIAKMKEERRILNQQESSIANITAKLQIQQQRLQSAKFGSAEFDKIAKEVERLTVKLDKANQKVRELTGQTQSGAARQSAAVRQVSQEFSKQDSYITNLLKKTAALWSINQVGNFITQVREVTAQFELQRVSLGAILQDQNKANQLFSEIKSFALKSPVSILDLTKYTKQLAAYKIGYDELFETTKKLTDVSVGLGVSMDRVVLAYGQVRATGYLRASEIRQFTEMGVPIVEELASKLSKMNGELVTAAQVMDLVSKRGISFEMVKDVFDDMTSAGGIFYNMQEKQGNTLYGLWAKLGDAASVMYSEIGNTGLINDGMKSLISGLTSLMKNWRLMAGEAMVAVASFGAYKAIQALTVVSTEASTKATQRLMVAKNGLTAAQTRLTAAQRLATASQNNLTRAQRLAQNVTISRAKSAVLEAQWTVKAAAYNRLAARATDAWTAAKLRLMAATSQLKAMVAGNWIMLTVAAVAAIVVAIGGAIEKATRLKRALDDIEASTVNLQNQSVGRFKHLAEAAVNAADGSKKQRDALAELSRTYGDILPQDALKLENLQKMDHKYGKLTATLKEYIAVQQKNKGMEEISNEYGGKINEASKKAIDSLVDYVGVERDVAISIVGEMQRDIQEKLEKGEIDFRTTGQKLQAAADKFGVKISDSLAGSMTTSSWYDNWYDHIGLDKATNEFQALTEAVAGQYNELDEWNKRVDASTGATGAWSKELEAAKKKIDELPLTNPDGSPIDNSTFQGSQIKANETMKVIADLINNDTQIKDAIKNKKVEWNNDWIHLVGSVDPKNLMDITTVNFDAIIEALDKKHPELADKIRDIQNEWGNVAPTNATAVQIKYKMGQIADAFKVSMDKMQKYLWDGSGSVDDYLKRLKDQQAELNARLKEKQQQLLNMGVMSKWWNKLLGNDIEAEVEQMKKEIKALDTLVPFVTGYTVPEKSKNKGRGGTKSDPRLQNLKEEISLTKKLYDEYHKLEKQIGATKAAEKIQEIYSNTIKTLQERAEKYGFTFELPFTDENLKSNMQHFIDKMKELQKLRDKKGKPLFSNIGKEIDEAVAQLEDVGLNSLQKALEKKLKELADRISRTKTAKEFYEKILSTTGNVDMAINLTTSIFGENGKDLNKQIALQINELMQSGEGGIEIGLDVVGDDYNINYKNLRKLIEEAYKAKKIGDQAYKDLMAIADNGEKDVSKMVDGWLKATEKAKSYSDKLLDLARTTNAEIAKIEAQRTAGNITDDYAKAQIQGYKDRQAQEIAKLQYEAFKDSPMYVQMFDDLDNASTTMLRNMKQRIEELKTSWKDLTPTQLKEMQSRLNEIDTQLAKRNPFKGLIDGIKEYRNLRKGGDTLGNKSEGAAEKALDAAAKARLEAEKEYLEILNKEGATQEEIADAKKRFDKAASNEDAAAKALENWKKVKDMIGLSANELFQMLNWAGDIAKGIADISEAMGADEEDVQYWNDVADALGQISGGIQDIVSAAMSANVVGIISSTQTAIPKMFVGFTNLFSAGKIKRANKEIKRQQELLEQLEYTYGRLEKAADKLFGRDYLNNYNQRMKVLQAQAAAYQKQYEAEKSKGKKADEEKLKEFQEQYRDTMDEIADMQDELTERILGTDVASAARDFANAWLDAYLSFDDTTQAIQDKFNDMIKNMVVNMALAQVVKNALQPFFKMVEELSSDGELSIEDYRKIFSSVPQYVEDINNGMAVGMESMKAAGLDLKSLRGNTDGFTGIAKSVAGATSEEINNVAAIGNTLMYYVSPIPRIDENLARVVAIMEGRGASLPTASGVATGAVDYTDLFNTANQHLSSLPRMEQHLAEIHTMLGRALRTKGATTGFNTFLNS